MSDCVFCKIINKELPTTVVYENDDVLAINDTSPQAPVHVVIMPKKHVENIIEFSDEAIELSPSIFKAISEVANIKNVDKSGFRIINNCGKNAGQTVPHVHFHLLAGTDMGERIV